MNHLHPDAKYIRLLGHSVRTFDLQLPNTRSFPMKILLTGVICREMGIASATLSKWKAKYGGLDVSDVQKLKTLEEEHSRLKRMYADLAMDNQLLRDLFSKKGWALPPNGK